MDKTNLGCIIPGGKPANKLVNPPSKEEGPTDSGEGQLLLRKESSRVNKDSQAKHNSLNTDIKTYKYIPQTQNELFLWQAWKKAEEKIEMLEKMIITLQQKQSNEQLTYVTDEEELKWEIEKIKGKPSKKRS